MAYTYKSPLYVRLGNIMTLTLLRAGINMVRIGRSDNEEMHGRNI